MTLLQEFDFEVDKDIKEVASKVVEFHGDLIKASPVDTGEFRDAWELIPNGKLSWTIFNPQSYSSILWAGRKVINDRTYGSEQWPEGGEPMVDKLREDLSK
ncbi:hypothetical protein PF327_10795 [Sulfurovum sp. XTW-4]|uniref:Uncharacterized protein n=1 Tax=Sulfurovum xiamenensis TaxID=3019066 RepID=A0ABT7QV82_9BACT|nr:hypothetical protein [Sulfurovum xiamenensis]MDM5264682.1 hypothetical protein [Sulfurovum xiamenensis]